MTAPSDGRSESGYGLSLELIVMNVAFVVLVGAIVWGVLSRYVTQNPATWVEEVSSIAFTVVVFVGASEVQRRGKHVRVDLLTSLPPRRAQGALGVAIGVFVALYCFYVAWLGLQQTIASNSATTSMLNVPLSVPYGAFALGFFLFGLRSVQRLWAGRTWKTMDAWPLALFILLLFLNTPVTVAIGAGALLFFLHQRGLPLTIFPQRLLAFSQSFPLVAIPMFTFAGVIMNHSGITARLLNFAETLVGHMSGALAQTNVLLATLMGFESGSGNADAAMQSKMLGAQMVRRGYPAPFAAAIVAASAVITPMMPPGLGFVLYGYLANVSVGRLFMAGIVPGFTMMTVLMVTTHFLSKRYGFQPVRDRLASPGEILSALRQASWALTVPFVVIFGLRYGIFTPTEAGAVIATYSLAVGLFVYRELKVSQLWDVVTEAALATATVMMIISAANALGYYMTLEQIASHVGSTLTAITTNPLWMLIVINIFLLLIGMVLESVATLILLTPILVPIARQVGIDPVHLGVLICLNVTLGAVHPPVGTLMFITCGVLDVRISDYTLAVLPLLAVQIAVLILLILFPPLVLTLPNWAFGVGQ